MRMMKLTLFAAAALVLGTAAANAITVKKRTEAPGLPPEVWAVAGGWCQIKEWHPALADCVESKEGDDTFRTLTLKDQPKQIKEKLTAKDDLSYSYEIVDPGPLPVKNYKSKLWVEADDEPDRTVIFWQSDFDAADGTSDADAEKALRDVLAAGVKGIKAKAIAAWDAAHPGETEQGDDDDDNN
jgi:hypothetical protein